MATVFQSLYATETYTVNMPGALAAPVSNTLVRTLAADEYAIASISDYAANGSVQQNVLLHSGTIPALTSGQIQTPGFGVVLAADCAAAFQTMSPGIKPNRFEIPDYTSGGGISSHLNSTPKLIAFPGQSIYISHQPGAGSDGTTRVMTIKIRIYKTNGV